MEFFLGVCLGLLIIFNLAFLYHSATDRYTDRYWFWEMEVFDDIDDFNLIECLGMLLVCLFFLPALLIHLLIKLVIVGGIALYNIELIKSMINFKPIKFVKQFKIKIVRK